MLRNKKLKPEQLEKLNYNYNYARECQVYHIVKFLFDKTWNNYSVRISWKDFYGYFNVTAPGNKPKS